jgi:hypothetical protein
MDLIDSYVQSVRLFLPSEQRDDIARELREDLRSQVEDKEAELGRSLTSPEQAALLRQYGHPMLMAARYRRGRNLIGPVIFPIYWQILKLILGLLTATNLASIGLLVVKGDSWSEIGAAVTRFLDNGLEAAVFITLVAAVCEWSLSRFKVLERWDPSSMRSFARPLQIAERAAQHAVREAGRTDSLVRRALDNAVPPLQVRSVSEFVMLSVFTAWSVLGLMFPTLIFANAASMLDWAPAVDRMFPVIVVVALLALVDQYVRLMRPAAQWLRVSRIVWANAGWVFIVLLAVADHRWVVWIGTPDQWARYGELAVFAGRAWSLVDIVNGVISAVLMVVALFSVIGPCWRLWRVFTRRGGAHTAHA